MDTLIVFGLIGIGFAAGFITGSGNLAKFLGLGDDNDHK